MKKFYYFVASMAFVLVVIMACEKSAIGVDETLTVKDEVLSAKGDKSQVIVDILHWDGEKFILISVAAPSVESHMAHGDKYPCFPDFVQDFTTNVDGWLNYGGTITHEVDHAIVEGGAFTRFDGYRNAWEGMWTAEIDVYLDPAWGESQGFEYSVAANGSDGNHRRDFIFHVNKDASTGGLLVAGDNNTNFAPREDLETLLNHYEVTTAGWYTFQHVFSDNGGVLSVDLNLIDSSGTTLFTETRSDASDLITSVVGGNRYGWFTLCNVAGGIDVDNTLLTHCE